MKTILFLGLEPPQKKENETWICYPVITIAPASSANADIINALTILSKCSFLIFTSKTAVDLFFALKPDQKSLENKRWIAVGTATAKRLHEKKIDDAYTAKEETAEGVVALIDALNIPQGTLFLWPHSARARRVIPNALNARGFSLTECILYDTLVQTPSPKPDLTTIDEIFFTSPSTIEGFLLAYGTLPKDKKLRAIGPVTAAALRNLA